MGNAENKNASNQLVEQAKGKLADDMEDRGITAIIWDNGTADFHYIPEIVTGQDKDGRDIVVRVTGLYTADHKLYAIEEGAPGTDIRNFYNPDTDVPPTTVTLTAAMASKILGEPAADRFYTTAGTNAEWLVIADCYFEALTEA